jgi:kazal-type serine protease inhibitor domain-containing protein 1
MRYGPCGESLECRIRVDLEPTDPIESICYCKNSEPICGSDGQTYENQCKLTEARYKKRDGLVAVSRGPCQSGNLDFV